MPTTPFAVLLKEDAMRVEWLTSIAELRDRNWDQLTEDGDLFRCCDWLDITASSDPGLADPPRYLMVFDDDGRPAAASPVYIQTADALPDPLVRVDLVQRDTLSRSPAPRDWSADLMPSMVCGGWVPFDSRALVAPGQRGAAALRVLLDELTDFATARGAATTTFLYTDAQNSLLRDALAERGFLSTPTLPRAVMDIAWPDFDGYLAGLRKSRRHTARADERMLAEAGVRFSFDEFTAADVPDFARLAMATASKYEPESSEAELSRWLITMQEQTHIPTVVVRASLGDQLCGYVLLVEWRGVLYPQHCGIDYAMKGKLPVYFGVVFYQTIRYALEHGIHRIEYNLGSSDVKESRGCTLAQQWTYVRTQDPAVQAALSESFLA
jgi:uncharacterized protein